MGTTRKTITVTDQQDEWIKEQIEAGRYTNDSEYIRDLIRRDQSRDVEIEAIRAELIRGEQSGVPRPFDAAGRPSMPESALSMTAKRAKGATLTIGCSRLSISSPTIRRSVRPAITSGKATAAAVFGRHAIYFRITAYGIAVVRVLHDRMDAQRHL